MQGLIIFIKNKKKGFVKTRLAATVGDDKALAIYEQLLQITQQVCLGVDAKRYVYYSNTIEQNDEWSSDFFSKKIQYQGDLGEKMYEAFREICTLHQKVVIIGSDCAALTSDIIQAAFDALDSHDVSIGPALDGGYYLLGLRAAHQSLFEDIAWSTASVLEATLQKAKSLQLSVYQLPTLSDIDNEADWNTFQSEKNR